MAASAMVYHIGKVKECPGGKSEIREFADCGEDASNERALNAAPFTVQGGMNPHNVRLLSGRTIP
jgi:hypothetical protein